VIVNNREQTPIGNCLPCECTVRSFRATPW
jgi:hypothetical protein